MELVGEKAETRTSGLGPGGDWASLGRFIRRQTLIAVAAHFALLDAPELGVSSVDDEPDPRPTG